MDPQQKAIVVENIAKKLLNDLRIAYRRLYANDHYAENDEIIQEAKKILNV